MAKENNIRAIKFLNWYFLRIALDDLDFTKPLKWEGGGQGGGVVQIAVEGTATVEGFVVPKPTAEEMTAIYNAIVAENNVYIVDSNDVYYQVLQADSVDGAINIEILYFSEMSLVYTLENETVTVTGKKIGGSGLPDQTGHSGKFLTTDGTDASWAAINALQNTATGANSLTILGTATSRDNATNIGVLSEAGSTSVAIGVRATTKNTVGPGVISIGNLAESKLSSIVLGNEAKGYGNTSICLGLRSSTNASATGAISLGVDNAVNAQYAIQLGGGGQTVTEQQTMWVAFGYGTTNYKLLDSDGTIPAARHASLPQSDGTYVLKLVITDGVPTLSWVAE